MVLQSKPSNGGLKLARNMALWQIKPYSELKIVCNCNGKGLILQGGQGKGQLLSGTQFQDLNSLEGCKVQTGLLSGKGQGGWDSWESWDSWDGGDNLDQINRQKIAQSG